MEPVIHYNTIKFSRKIIIQKVKKVVEKAHKNILDLTLWSNGSKSKSGAKAVIA